MIHRTSWLILLLTLAPFMIFFGITGAINTFVARVMSDLLDLTYPKEW
jgi:hypothetical protein